jgi:hypothetical protein
MEPLPFEKPGAGVDLTFIARFILIPGTVRRSQPLANLFRWVNRRNYYEFMEETNSKAPSLSSVMTFSIRSMPSRIDQRKDNKKQVKIYQLVARQP